MARRLAGRYGYSEAPNHFDVTLRPDRLDQPLKWKKPKRIFTVSMGDLFHPLVPVEFIDEVFATITRCPQHIFLLLTKRPQQMMDYVLNAEYQVWCRAYDADCMIAWSDFEWPLPNVWLGVTAENQEQADKRIPLLLQVPAAVRFVSVEPMLSAVDLSQWLEVDYHALFAEAEYEPISRNDPRYEELSWCIVGAETGPGARPMKLEWARDLRDQCKQAGVPFFFKKATGGGVPDDLMIREFPE